LLPTKSSEKVEVGDAPVGAVRMFLPEMVNRCVVACSVGVGHRFAGGGKPLSYGNLRWGWSLWGKPCPYGPRPRACLAVRQRANWYKIREKRAD
jgi:hypothetical protein